MIADARTQPDAPGRHESAVCPRVAQRAEVPDPGPTRQQQLRQRRREAAERLLERASCLPQADFSLLSAAYGDGRSGTELAALMGRSPRAMRRRIQRLTTRVMSQEYLFVLRHRGSWSTTRRRIATACVLHGRSQRQAARELGISLHLVRSHYAAVVALFEAATGQAWGMGASGLAACDR